MWGCPTSAALSPRTITSGNERSHYQQHFASQIVLHRLLVSFHSTLSNGRFLARAPSSNLLSDPGMSGPSPSEASPSPAHVSQSAISQLQLQLEKWIGMLPVHLRWHQHSPAAFPDSVSSLYAPASAFTLQDGLGANPAAQMMAPQTDLMFTTDLVAPPRDYPFALDIQVALLRSRYYYTKHLINRPFIYKALHFPDALSNEDCLGVAECLKSSVKWPITMSPVSKHKRLIPCIFFWSQNLLGILVLLHLSQNVPVLLRIRRSLCGDRFDLDANESIGLYIDWLRDVRAVDESIKWCWDVVKTLYELEESF